MVFLVIAFAAGVLTVFAPCVFPLLPVVVGSSVSQGRTRHPFWIIGALGVSVLVFTLVLKVSTTFIDIPDYFWKWFSGGLIILVAIAMLAPRLWENSFVLRLQGTVGGWLGISGQRGGIWGDVLVGAALGPVFSTCSPTYFIILATVLPASLPLGLLYLVTYVVGLCLMLYVVSLLGRVAISKLGFLTDPHGTLKRIAGVVFLLVGIGIIGGWDKKLQTYVLDQGFFDVTKIENVLLEWGVQNEEGGSPVNRVENKPNEVTVESLIPSKKYHELVGIAGYINSEPFTLAQTISQNKVVLIEFWTFGCINCKRTLPHLNTLYTKYQDQGLEIVGVHTPEFAYEKKQENVEKFVKEYDIRYPVVLDNSYETWNSYDNRYWPRVYIINKRGEIVYDHIGEGGYREADEIIQKLLREPAE
jgi:cytochrome c biogenesis protein CcdA/thiol-disulfide isomerase/thioredoxin